MALTQIKTTAIADDAVTTDKLANAINTERTANTAKVSLENDSVTGAKIADDAVGAEHIEVLDAALQFGDNVKAQFGASNDLEIYHNGTDTGLVNNTGGLYIQNDGTVFIGDVGGNEFGAKFIDNGAVELYYNNSKKFETSSIGVTLNGDFTNNAGSYINNSGGHVQIGHDSGRLKIGASQDLQLYHNGTNSVIHETTGHLRLQTSTANKNIIFEHASNGDYYAIFNQDGACEFYYDNSKKFETTANGVTINDNQINLKRSSTTDQETIFYYGSSYLDIETREATGIRLKTNKQDRLIIDSSGRILAGTTSVGWDGADDLTVAGSADVGITIRSGDDDLGTLAFADGTSGADGYRGWVQYKQSSEYMTMGTNGTQRLRVDGDGLKFGTDSAAANALDDYEEGSFTVVASDFSGTCTTNQASYTKVGRLVHIQGMISFSNTSDNSAISLGGLPFQNIGGNGWNPFTIQTSRTLTETSDEFPMIGRVASGLSSWYVLGKHGDQSVTYNKVNNGWIIFAGTYQAA